VVLTALSHAIEARDPFTRGHSARVSAIAEVIARRQGWRSARLDALRLGGQLHDVGKLNLDSAVLHKAGPLDERELIHVRGHPAAGARLIRPFTALHPALPYVLFHHERWDGSGYPSGRAHEQIPSGARILAVADAFDAMISHRPYRAALPVHRGLAEVRECAGSQFDPAVVRAFLAAWAQGDFDEIRAA
jgi:HD-GYP domain-containing protein (c-di-GMP phosphodiesterase class II)